MRKEIFLILFLVLISCKNNENENSSKNDRKLEDSKELNEIYKNDQADRQSHDINWPEVSKRDSLRRIRVRQLIDSNMIRTSKDFKNAAMIFQHGNNSADYKIAVKLIKRAIKLDSTTDKWLLAAATDRYLLSRGDSQIYGTQYQKMGNEPWKLAKIDTTKISDEERIKFGVETLSQQREKVKRMNSEEHKHDH